MNDPKLIRLMHEVLDGEASPEDTRELERRVATDPGALAAYEELQRLFEALGRVPKAFPPEGLVAAVTAKLPARTAPQDRPNQLFSQSGVIGASPDEMRGIRTGSAARVQRTSDPKSYVGGNQMNDEQKRGSFSKNKVWIGIGLALAGVVVATQYFNFPPTSETTSGTIVPAQRHRAEQPTAADVKLGGQSGGQTSQGNQAGIGTTGSDARGGDARGGDSRGGDALGGDSRGGDARGGDSRGGDSRGGDSRGGDSRGGDSRGGDSRGGDSRGGDSRGGDSRGGDARGGDSRGGDARGGDSRGGDARGGDGRGGDARGGDSRGGDSRGETGK